MSTATPIGIESIRKALGLDVALKAVILIVGGANAANDDLRARLVQLFSRGLARPSAEDKTLFIDRSTEGDIKKALGEALQDRTSKAFLLGIASDNQITWPSRDAADTVDGAKMLESNYTHFVVVKGADSRSEIDTMCGIVEEFSQDVPVLTLLVSDSPTAKDEVVKSVRQAWPILVIEGSGGFADEIQKAWQTKQRYIQDLSEWKPNDPNKTKPNPPFIADPVLAEVIAEGNLHFFAVTEMPEKLELCIDLKLKGNDILSQAYTQCRIYDDVANRQQKIFRWQQFFILLLGVLITALAALQAYYKQRPGSVPPLSVGGFDVLYYTLISMPIILAVLIAGANRFNAGNKWIAMRAATEAFKREMFRYRTRTGLYSDIQVVHSKTTREATLAKMLETISRQWVEHNLDFSVFPAPTRYPNSQQAPSRLIAIKTAQEKSKGRHSVYLLPNQYIEERLIDQLNFYKNRSQKLGWQLALMQWMILILGGTATLLAALHAELIITVTTAIATALVTYLEYNQVVNTQKQYNHAILTLTNIQNWWVALEDAQADQANIDKLVDYIETTLQSEQAGWVQQLQSALTELRAQQAKQGGDAAATEPINKGIESQSSVESSQDDTPPTTELSSVPADGSEQDDSSSTPNSSTASAEQNSDVGPADHKP